MVFWEGDEIRYFEKNFTGAPGFWRLPETLAVLGSRWRIIIVVIVMFISILPTRSNLGPG